MKLPCQTFTMRFKFSSRAMAFSAALLLGIFSAGDSSASQTIYAMRLLYAPLVGGRYPAMIENQPFYYFYYIGERPSPYEAFPFLNDLKYNPSGAPAYLQDWVPYGTWPYSDGSFKYPFVYRLYSTVSVGNMPDSWDQSDIDRLNQQYQALSDDQKFSIPGTVICGETSSGDKFIQFNQSTPATEAYSGGVYTYDENGNVVVSFPDNTGYISGYKQLPDGTFTPTYYTLDNHVVTEVSFVPTQEYSTLEYDTETQQYSLNVPDYSSKLDLIVNKIDGIRLNYDPVVNVTTPDVNVNVSGSDLSDVEASLVGIGNLLQDSLGTNSFSQLTFTNDVGLTSDEVDIISRYRTWETGIPLVGSTLDTGLTLLFGRLPALGQEFDWIDITPQASGASSGTSSLLSGFRIHVTLEPYRNLILSFRGWVIIAEALLFIILCWRLIREALKV